MKDIIDLHTHTIASGHAYNTINEMVQAAAERGVKVLGITEHAPAMKGTCSELYFSNLKALSRKKQGIRVLYGAEVNILDIEGHVDLPERILAQMDVVIASMHIPCFKSGSMEENTRTYLNVMKNPYVNIIGHPDDGRYPVDHRALAEAAREHDVLLEVNNSSLSPLSMRVGAADNYRSLLAYCREFETAVIVGSDAHVDLDVGNHELAQRLLSEVEFPKELVVNGGPEMLKKYLRNRAEIADMLDEVLC